MVIGMVNQPKQARQPIKDKPIMNKQVSSLVVIGAGPAGYTAALYAARAGLEPVLYQGLQPGGQVTTTSKIENYPGYRHGIDGSDLMEEFRAQALHFGATIKDGEITSVDFSLSPKKLIVNGKEEVWAKTVIIATGSTPKWLGLEGEKTFLAKGVSTCAICDGFFFKGEVVAVVGGGDSAAEEAIYLSKLCKKVYVLVRKDRLRASHIMQNRLHQSSNIEILFHTEVKNILGDDVVHAIEVVDNQSQQNRILDVKALFVAIGHQANSKLFVPYVTTDEQGYIVTKAGTTQTNVPGVFAAGDVQDPHYRQVITAAGTGCMAALEAERFLQYLDS